MDWCHGFRRPWSVCSSRCYAGKAPFSVLSPLTGSRQAAWSTGIGLFLLGTQKANCKRAITGTAAALPPLPFCSIWDLTAVVSTCVFCTVAGTRVYATLLLHAPSWNTQNLVCWDGFFLLGTQKASCKCAIPGTVAALPTLPFCSIWDLTAVVSTCVFCTVAGTGVVYATTACTKLHYNRACFGEFMG